jgi:nitroreductase
MATGGIPMDLFEAIQKRRSVRAFQSKPIAREELEKIIDAGRCAPTARNEQPWEFVVVTDMYARQRIAELTTFGKFIADAAACVAVFCRASTPYYLEDGAAATENLLLAATALGIGSCWVAGDRKPYAPDIAAALGVPGTHKLVALVALGYQGDETPRKPRRPLKEVIHWENW